VGIFDAQSKLFTLYDVEIAMRDKLIGGTPRDPKLIQGWLRSKMGLTDETEIRAMTRETLIGLGLDIPEDATYEDMVAASEKLAGEKQTTGFKQTTVLVGSKPTPALMLEGRQIKAMLKELVNILYAGEKWGKTLKGPKNFLAERVFPAENEIVLFQPDGKTPFSEPSGVEMMIGHVVGPTGPRSTLGYHEYVSKAVLRFTLKVAQDSIPQEAWPDLWVLGQENGLGATRSQGFGTFDVNKFEVKRQGDKVPTARKGTRAEAAAAAEAELVAAR